MSVSPDGTFALVAENVSHTLAKYSVAGEKVWSLDRRVTACDISNNGDAYALTSAGTIYGDKLLVVSTRDGSILKEKSVGGFDVVIDDQRNKIWVAGADIKRLDLGDLSEDFGLDPIQWCAVSVDYTTDGGAWVAERRHSQVNGSRSRMIKVSSDGDIVKTVDVDDQPYCLAVNRTNDTVWVVAGESLYVFDSTGKQVREIESGRAWTVRIRHADGSAWVATRQGNILQFDNSGRRIRSIQGFSTDQKYVAVP